MHSSEKRYHSIRAEIIAYLGGKCAKCGDINNLEIDHINSKEKKFEVAKNILTVTREKIWEELKKCQLLCRICHTEKTIEEMGNKIAKGKHGTNSAYRWCGPPKCQACKEAHNIVHRIWREKKASVFQR